jgi:hypothetical protein
MMPTWPRIAPPIRKPRGPHGLDNKAMLAIYLGITRPTLYAALREGRLTLTTTEIIYQPAKIGRKKAIR